MNWFTPGVLLVLSWGAQRTMMRLTMAGMACTVSFQPVSYGAGGTGGPVKNGVGSTTMGRVTGIWPLINLTQERDDEARSRRAKAIAY